MSSASQRRRPGKRRFWKIAGVAIAIMLGQYGLISFYITQQMTRVERTMQEDHPRNYGLTTEEVEFPSRRGDVSLSGWYLAGNRTAGAAEGPAVIFVHGLGSVRSSDAAVGLAARLVERGYSALLFDLRGHGSSGGEEVSGGYFERWDVLGAYDYLLKERGHTAGEVGLIGFSMGAATAILTAELEPEIPAVVADTTYTSVSDLLAQEVARKTPLPDWITPVFIPGTELMANGIYGINIGELAPEKAIAGLGYPLLIIHGDADQRVPVGHGERVAAAAPAGSAFWRTPGVDHVDSFKAFPAEYVERVTSYLSGRLMSHP